MSIRDLDHQTMPPYEFKRKFESALYNEVLSPIYQDNEPYIFQNQIITFNEVPERSGVYMLCFPNGMSYIGQSSNVRIRIFTHLSNILYSYEGNNSFVYWYYKAKQTLCLKGTTEMQYQKLLSLIKIKLCYTHYPVRGEQYILSNIYLNKEYNKYYNSEYINPQTLKKIQVRRKGELII